MATVVYVIGVIIGILVIYRAYYRITFPFWARQPVFVRHNIVQWFSPRRVIDVNRPTRADKFYNPKIAVVLASSCEKEIWDDMSGVLRDSYSAHKDYRYHPSANQLSSLLTSHQGSHVALVRNKTGHPIGCISSRPLTCRLGNRVSDVNYVDHLCVKTSERKRGAAPQLIVTLSAEIRERTGIPVCLFKREGATTPIVPLVCAITTATRSPLPVTHPGCAVYEQKPQDAVCIVDELSARSERYTCVMHPNKVAFLAVLNSGQMRVFKCNIGNWYVFKSSHIVASLPVVECIVCLKSDESDKLSFRMGYAECLRKLHKGDFTTVIDGLGDNVDIQSWCRTIRFPEEESTATYYLYNYVEHSHKCDQVVILA
jgi:hypothetical protein